MEKQVLKRILRQDMLIGDILGSREAKTVLERLFPHLFGAKESHPVLSAIKWVPLKELVRFPYVNLSNREVDAAVEALSHIDALIPLADMAVKRIPLWVQSQAEDESDAPGIQLFLLKEDGPHPVMLIAPGGAYSFHVGHEAYPVAHWLNSIGISAAVLNYRVAPHKHPAPLSDMQRAIRLIRHHASEWNIDPDRVGVLGFSAGGHLASAAGTHFDSGDKLAEDLVERISSRPDAMVLCYPVITMGEHTHASSRMNLLGGNDNLAAHLSSELQVTKDTPPAFLWHTAEDEAVDARNSLLFAAALSRHKIPYALHIFERGPHGLGLAEEHPEAQAWTSLCEAWLRERGF